MAIYAKRASSVRARSEFVLRLLARDRAVRRLDFTAGALASIASNASSGSKAAALLASLCDAVDDPRTTRAVNEHLPK